MMCLKVEKKIEYHSYLSYPVVFTQILLALTTSLLTIIALTHTVLYR